MNEALRKAQTNIKRWREDPVTFVVEELNVEPDPWQVKVLRAFPSQDPDKLRISMQACVGPGKTAVMAWCGWNFISCYGDIGEHPKGASLSITRDNLNDNLWPEYAKWQSRSEYLKKAFQWTKSRIYAIDHEETWFLSARSFRKDADAETMGKALSGLHGKFLLVQLDESGEIPLAIGRAAEQIFSDKEARFLKVMQAGNPSSQSGLLYEASISDLWYKIRITGDPDDPERSSRINIDRAREQIEKYGRDNPWVMYSILGKFPPGGINALLGVEDVQDAMKREPKLEDYYYSEKRLGVDVARFGDDETIIFPRQGLRAFKPVPMRNARSYDIAGRVAAAENNWESNHIAVDATGGYGSGVIDYLDQGGRQPIEVHFNGKANDPDRFFNKRSEMWWEMAEWIKKRGRLPKGVEKLTKELTAPTYSYQNGKLRLEEKEQIKKRLGFSPDRADALALTFAEPEVLELDREEVIKSQAYAIQKSRGEQVDFDHGSGKMISEFDPFEDRDD